MHSLLYAQGTDFRLPVQTQGNFAPVLLDSLDTKATVRNTTNVPGERHMARHVLSKQCGIMLNNIVIGLTMFNVHQVVFYFISIECCTNNDLQGVFQDQQLSDLQLYQHQNLCKDQFGQHLLNPLTCLLQVCKSKYTSKIWD